ncbi:hypothetical protein [Bacillus paramycoides]|uniref:DUF3967 domain-containing protein n=1 Tax=Bacillus paramycoides TaxID=2026194 RepID=A0A1J9UQA8_9BACI|nr:hypothetical protein [Bacillus paramycoides]OJD80982.1 hypothetical protein BAU28_08865 [Bacillus paramycoides]
MDNNSFYLDKEVRKLLKIDNNTLNTMCQEFEQRGYTFTKTEQNQYSFRDNDILLLRSFLTLAKTGMSLEAAANKVLLIDETSNSNATTKKQDQNNENSFNPVDRQVLLKLRHMNQELLQQINEQQKHYESLLQKQQSYIENALLEINKKNMSIGTDTLEKEKITRKRFLSWLFGE